MMALSAKVRDRITTQLKKYQHVLRDAKQRDISESDTVRILHDILADALGYDKYKEISSEHAIRGTFVDLVVTVDEKKRFLLEAKAANVDLKENHVKQAIDYGANEGVPWIILTNGSVWRLYLLKFGKPIDRVLVFEIDLLACDVKSDDVVECFGSLCAEGYSKDALADLINRKQTSSKFTIAAVMCTDAMIESLRREVRRLSGIRLESDLLRSVIENDILKRELVESDEAKEAASYVKRLQKASQKEKAIVVAEAVVEEISDAPAIA